MGEDRVVIDVRVIPNSSRNRCDGFLDGRYRIRLQAVPERGKANRALIDFLAKSLGVKRSHITLLAGATAREKRLEIRGLRPEVIDGRLRQGTD